MTSSKGEEKSILITGSSAGIGLHLSKAFLDDQWIVYGVSRSNTPVKSPRFHQIHADMCSAREVDGMLKYVEDLNIHALINNVGANGPIRGFEETSLDQWINTFTLNLFSPLKLTQKLIPTLRRNRGSIIFLSGGGAAYPRVNFSAYSVSKTAVVRMAETLAIELHPDISVYAVAPGPNKTALLEEAMAAGDSVPEDRIVGFDKPIKLVRFLINNEDQRYSGKFIHVNDSYERWSSDELTSDKFTLRRVE